MPTICKRPSRTLQALKTITAPIPACWRPTAPKYLADEAGAYWLFDLVWGVLPKLTEEFAILELSLKEGTDGAGLKIHDGRDPETDYHRQEIVRTDFPLPSVTLYIQQNRSDWVVLLPSEY